jgi:hypothetical protein
LAHHYLYRPLVEGGIGWAAACLCKQAAGTDEGKKSKPEFLHGLSISS